MFSFLADRGSKRSLHKEKVVCAFSGGVCFCMVTHRISKKLFWIQVKQLTRSARAPVGKGALDYDGTGGEGVKVASCECKHSVTPARINANPHSTPTRDHACVSE